MEPYLRTNRFQGDGPLRRKENSSQGPPRRLRVQLRYRGESTSRCRNFNRLPFRRVMRNAYFKTEFPYVLGSTNPCPTAVHMEPFPPSVLKVLIWGFATPPKICTRGRSTRDPSKASSLTPTPAYSPLHRFY